jgi:hypothetical protein
MTQSANEPRESVPTVVAEGHRFLVERRIFVPSFGATKYVPVNSHDLLRVLRLTPGWRIRMLDD